MKKLAIVLALCSLSYGLQAPYLISATATSDSIVILTWRNNDISTTGFIVQRKDSTEATYKFIDSVKSATTTTYFNRKGLRPTTLYEYQVIAYNGTVLSDTSNSLKVTTLAKPVDPPPPPKGPTLISAAALSVNSVRLNWRDNGTTTRGFIVQRRDSTETAFHFIDSIKSALTLIYTDTTGLRSWTLYSYFVIAYDAMDVQDTSSIVQVMTKQEIFKNPSVSVAWNFETSSSVKLTISDSSNCEIGYRIYRADGYSSGFNPIATIISTRPDSTGAVAWDDNTVVLNQWYRYKTIVYKGDSSISSSEIKVMTLHSVPMSTNIVFQKLSDYPASLSGLSAKAGDSIIFKENPSPAGKFTVINVNDPLNPKFDGYIDSTALLSYPQQTLIPAFLKFGVYNSLTQTQVIRSKDLVLVSNGAVLSMYKIANDSLVFIQDSMIPQGKTIRQMVQFTDTLLAVVTETSYSYSSPGAPISGSTSGSYSYINPVRLSSSGFSYLPGYQIPVKIEQSSSYTLHSSSSTHSSGYFNIHGCYNENIIMSIRQWNSSVYTAWTNPPVTSHDSSASVAVVEINGNPGMIVPLNNTGIGWPNTSVIATGYYLSITENLCRAGTELFVADIRDLPDGYRTAVANNTIFRDLGGLQNILLDTLHKKAYVFHAGRLSILSYQRQPVGIANRPSKLSASRGMTIIRSSSRPGITIVLPPDCHSADLFFYDISGRIVDRIRNITSNVVFWRPKIKSSGFYIAEVRRNKEKFSAKILIH